MPARGPCGISPVFPGLSPAPGQVAHVLRTRPPPGSAPEGTVLARLACVRHAASVGRTDPPPCSAPRGSVLARLACVRHAACVRPEPRSNPPQESLNSSLERVHYSRRSESTLVPTQSPGEVVPPGRGPSEPIEPRFSNSLKPPATRSEASLGNLTRIGCRVNPRPRVLCSSAPPRNRT